MVFALAALAVVSGLLPPALGVATGVVWTSGDASAQAGCSLLPPAGWRCEVPESARGIVLMTGDRGVAWALIGPGLQADSNPRVRRWGRLVALTSPSVDDDLRGLVITAWKPDRSAVRRLADRFYRVEDQTIDVLRLSDTAVWIAGDTGDRDRFVSFDGLNVGSYTLSVAALANGPPESPLLVSLAIPSTLSGRVQDGALQGVAGADVEIFSPVEGSGSMMFHDRTVSDIDGFFVFPGLGPGPCLLVVTHPTAGRGLLPLRRLAEPVVIRVTPPLRASGRVLRRELPVPSARVRFVPEPNAFIATIDPHDLISEEAVTGDDGRFVLVLPPRLAGMVQAIGPDGTSVRVPIPSSVSGHNDASPVALGDVTLPDRRALTVRLLDGESCSMSAVGPLGALGLSIIRAVGGGGVYWFDVPEAGEWALGVDCGGVSYAVQPRVVAVPEQGPDTIVDAHLVR